MWIKKVTEALFLWFIQEWEKGKQIIECLLQEEMLIFHKELTELFVRAGWSAKNIMEWSGLRSVEKNYWQIQSHFLSLGKKNFSLVWRMNV